MSDAIQFVKNHEDLSTDRGFQFKFFCDKCGNGYQSSFQASAIGTVSSFLRVAGNLFGGALGRVGNSTYDIQRAVGGKGHDEALRKAVAELKGKFKQCTRCGKWVCPEICWNEKRNLCEECAPDLAQEVAAAQAQAEVEQVREKVRNTDYVANVDVTVDAVAQCPNCNARVGAARFCPECGQAVAAKASCKKCGAELAAAVKFCAECGERRAP